MVYASGPRCPQYGLGLDGLGMLGREVSLEVHSHVSGWFQRNTQVLALCMLSHVSVLLQWSTWCYASGSKGKFINVHLWKTAASVLCFMGVSITQL